MSYQVLARKWRPRLFQDMVGQSHVLQALINALDTDRLHHAYLFTGTRGVGKTTLARILAKCLNCEAGVSSKPCGECGACLGIDEGRFIDLIEVDAASRAKVEETRDLMDNVQYAPTSGRYKVYLIDEVHMFSNHSFNALLKTLEEPPPHVKFLLATTEAKKIPITILSRCLQFNLKHLTSEQIEQQLISILKAEGIGCDAVAGRLIAIAAEGSMRDALSILDQAISYARGELTEAAISTMLGTLKQDTLFALLDNIIANKPAEVIQQITRMAETAPDYDTVLAELLALLHQIAVAQVLLPETDTIDPAIKPYADKLTPEDIQLYYQILLHGRQDIAMAPDSRMGFEMTIIRLLAFQPWKASPPAAGQDQPGRRRDDPVAGSTNRAPVAAPTQAKQTQADDPLPVVSGEGWQKLIEQMALTGLARELAAHCSLQAYDSEKIHLVLPPGQEYLLKAAQKERLQEAIRQHLGEQIRLLITVDDCTHENPVQMQSRKAAEARQAAVQSIQDDNHVQHLLTTFDGTIDQEATRLVSGTGEQER